MATFVLVHGAMHGGWCWRRVVPLLRDHGHAVYTPTLTGMGERCHLLSPAVGLTTHVRDVLGVLTYEDLTGVVLVGHSYAGMVITAVAAEAPERLGQLVFLDAFTPYDGEAAFDLEPPEGSASMRDWARSHGDGWRLPPTETFLDRWGLRRDEDRRWVWGKLTDIPLRCFEDKVPPRTGDRPAKPRTYIECTDPVNPGLCNSAQRARTEGWRYRSLTTGHDAMVTAPAELARLLLELG